MKIELKLIRDSYNTDATDSLIIEESESKKEIYLQITDDNRIISVNKEELKKIIAIL